MGGVTSPGQSSGPLGVNGHRLVEGDIKVVVWGRGSRTAAKELDRVVTYSTRI